MIEIIKKDTKKIITCFKCGCKFSYEEEDIKREKKYDKHYTFIDYPISKNFIKEYIKCPQCDSEIVIKMEK